MNAGIWSTTGHNTQIHNADTKYLVSGADANGAAYIVSGPSTGLWMEAKNGGTLIVHCNPDSGISSPANIAFLGFIGGRTLT
jgi:hypothetical protein